MEYMNDLELLAEFTETRNIKEVTAQHYGYTIQNYTEFQEMSMCELLEEAEQEEEDGIRWKHRKLKNRLIKYRSYLNNKYLHKTAKEYFSRILTMYRHFEIEIHELPPINKKNVRLSEPINFKDLPDKEIIRKALEISVPLMRAIILFMSSSGTARTETLNLTIQEFIDATNEYHNHDNIYDVIDALEDKEDIVPIFQMKRQKTNKHYYTFCSPEACKEIISYLKIRKQDLKNSDKLFKMNKMYFIQYFIEINNTLGLGKAGTFNRFRSHMLRKFHASQLYNDGVSLEIVDALQGRGKDSTHNSYFMEDPEKLKQIYIEHMNAVTINLEVNSLDMKSPEYIKLETENKENVEKISNYEDMFCKLDERLKKLEADDDVGFDEVEDLF